MRKYWLFALLAAAVIFMQPASVYAGTNDFTITDFAIQYDLGRDDSGRSTLKTTEKITALFPEIDQNHGLERALPNSYDGHSISLKLQSVTDESGKTLPYSLIANGNLTVLRIGEASTYVHGAQTYIISYTSRDVTKYFADTGRDEFYWDTNGTGWLVPINRLSVTLRLDDAIAAKRTGKEACYQGVSGAAAPCVFVPNETSTQYDVTAAGLGVGENLTIALGFAPNTFQHYQKTLIEKLSTWWLLWQLVSGALMLVALIVLIMRAKRYHRPRLGAIAPEFISPKNTDIQTAALVAGHSATMFSAQIVDLAVRHYLIIHLVQEKTMFVPAEYELEIIKDSATLLPEEQAFLTILFGGRIAVGSRLNLKTLKNDTSLTKAFWLNRNRLTTSLNAAAGYWAEQDADRAYFMRAAGVFVVIALTTVSLPFVIVSLASIIIATSLKSMTQKGVELYRYTEGLKLYIGAAEAEQLRMLQSPEGADKVGDLSNGNQKITLYERLLPYAVLFGLEKNWSKVLGDMYATNGVQPQWYDGSGTNVLFNAAVLNSVVGTMNSSLTTYSSSSSFSSSGGSGGGGFSGGGGGGGGGGGW